MPFELISGKILQIKKLGLLLSFFVDLVIYCTLGADFNAVLKDSISISLFSISLSAQTVLGRR